MNPEAANGHDSGVTPQATDYQAQLDELSALAVSTRKAAGLTVSQVAKSVSYHRAAVSRLNTGKWVEAGLARSTMKTIFEAMKASDETIARALILYDEIKAATARGSSRRPSAAPSDRGPQLIERWGCAPPRPPHRMYASLDRLVLRVRADGQAEGTIERLEPLSQRRARWTCRGYGTNRSLHLTFWPAPSVDGAPQSDSIGHISVQRHQSATGPWFGHVSKLERREGRKPRLNSYEYWMSTGSDPRLIHVVSSVAVVDFDNTLARGWILGPWLERLAAEGIGASAEAIDGLRRRFAEYEAKASYGHDRLASDVASIYARALEGVRVTDVEAHAGPFVADYTSDRRGHLFSSSRALLDGLKKRGLRPVLITGAPKEVVDELGRELGILTTYSLVLRASHGVFTGEIAFNHGLASMKDTACQQLEDADSSLMVAVGDSEGDRPMWRRATTAIQIGGTDKQSDIDIADVDLSEPLSETFWAQIPTASWLDAVAGADD